MALGNDLGFGRNGSFEPGSVGGSNPRCAFRGEPCKRLAPLSFEQFFLLMPAPLDVRKFRILLPRRQQLGSGVEKPRPNCAMSKCHRCATRRPSLCVRSLRLDRTQLRRPTQIPPALEQRLAAHSSACFNRRRGSRADLSSPALKRSFSPIARNCSPAPAGDWLRGDTRLRWW